MPRALSRRSRSDEPGVKALYLIFLGPPVDRQHFELGEQLKPFRCLVEPGLDLA